MAQDLHTLRPMAAVDVAVCNYLKALPGLVIASEGCICRKSMHSRSGVAND